MKVMKKIYQIMSNFKLRQFQTFPQHFLLLLFPCVYQQKAGRSVQDSRLSSSGCDSV